MKTTGAPPLTTVDRLLEQVSDLETMIRRESEDAERNRRLSSDVTNALRDIGCFRMFRPRSRGGLEFDPVSARMANSADIILRSQGLLKK